MLRRSLLCAIFLFAAKPAIAALCDLSMVVSCQTGVNGAPSSCMATTMNNGSTACAGLVYSAWFSEESPAVVQLTAPQTSPTLDTCLDSTEFGELVEQAISFCFGDSAIGPHQTLTSTVHISGVSPRVPLVAVTWVGTEEGEEIGSAYAFANVDAPTCTPTISAPPVTQSGVGYTVTWTAVSDPTAQFLIEESTSSDFTSNVTSTQVNGLSKAYFHDNLSTTTTYYYRVRATNCSGGATPFSRIAQTVVQAVPARVTGARMRPCRSAASLPCNSKSSCPEKVHRRRLLLPSIRTI